VDELANILRAPLQEESPEKLAEMNKAASGQNWPVKLVVGTIPATSDTRSRLNGTRLSLREVSRGPIAF